MAEKEAPKSEQDTNTPRVEGAPKGPGGPGPVQEELDFSEALEALKGPNPEKKLEGKVEDAKVDNPEQGPPQSPTVSPPPIPIESPYSDRRPLPSQIIDPKKPIISKWKKWGKRLGYSLLAAAFLYTSIGWYSSRKECLPIKNPLISSICKTSSIPWIGRYFLNDKEEKMIADYYLDEAKKAQEKTNKLLNQAPVISGEYKTVMARKGQPLEIIISAQDKDIDDVNFVLPPNQKNQKKLEGYGLTILPPIAIEGATTKAVLLTKNPVEENLEGVTVCALDRYHGLDNLAGQQCKDFTIKLAKAKQKAPTTSQSGQVEAKPESEKPKLAPVTGHVKKEEPKRERIPIPAGYAVRSPGSFGYAEKDATTGTYVNGHGKKHFNEEQGLSLHRDGNKLYVLVTPDINNNFSDDGRGLEALVLSENDHQKADLDPCGFGSVELKDSSKIGAVAVKEGAEGKDNSIILASSTFSNDTKNENIANMLQKPYECISEKDKEQLEAVIEAPVIENKAPSMQNMNLVVAEKGKLFEAKAYAIDDEDVPSAVVSAIKDADYNGKYGFGAENTGTQKITSGANVSEIKVTSQNPIEGDFKTRLCATDPYHNLENVSLSKQCMDYAVTFNEAGMASVVSSPVEEQGPVAKAEPAQVPLEWDEETKEAEKKLEPKGEFDVSLEEEAQGAIAAEAAPLPADDSFTLSIRPKSSLKNRLLHRKQGNIQQPYTLDPSSDHPNGLRRLDPLPDNKKYIVHTDSKTNSLDYTTYLEDGTSVSKPLRVNRHGNAKLKQRRIPNNAVVLRIQDPASKDKLAMRLDDKHMSPLIVHDAKTDEYISPIKLDWLDENGTTKIDTKYKLAEGETYNWELSPEMIYLHDTANPFILKAGEKEEPLINKELKVAANENTLAIGVHAHSNPVEGTVTFTKEKKNENNKETKKVPKQKTNGTKTKTPAKQPKVAEQAPATVSKERAEGVKLSDRIGLEFSVGAKDLYSVYETPTWKSNYEGDEKFVRLDSSWRFKDTLGLGGSFTYGQKYLDMDDGDLTGQKINLGVYLDGKHDREPLKLRFFGGYNRISESSDIDISGMEIKQDKTTDRLSLNALGSHSGLGIDIGGIFDSYKLEQDNPDSEEYGRDYSAWIGPFFDYKKLMIETYFKQISRYNIDLEKDLTGQSGGVYAAYNGERFSAYGSAELPMSGDLRIDNFGAGLSLKPFKKPSLFLNLSGGYMQEMYDEGSNEVTNQSTYGMLGISNKSLNTLRTPHIQMDLLH